MSVTGQDVSETSLEREKFELDSRIREADLNLKIAEARRSKWANPLTVAVLGAVIVGAGNIGVALYNASLVLLRHV
jgi:hypothetical protein